MKNSELKKIVARFGKLVNGKSSLDILNHLKLEGGILTGTDLETTLSLNTSFEGSGLVPFVELKKIVAKIPATKQVQGFCSGNYFKLAINGKVKFTFDLTEKIEDFPVMLDSVNISAGQVDGAKILSCVPFMCKDELRPIMCGVFLGQNHYVATDMHTLRYIENKEYTGGDLVLPKSATKLIAANKMDSFIDENAKYLKLLIPGGEIVTRTMSGRYPQYTEVIPQKFNTLVELDGAKLLEEVNLGLIAATKDGKRGSFNFNGEADIHIEGNGCTFTSSIPCDTVGENINIDFNCDLIGKVLKEAIKKSETITFEMVNEYKATIINNEFLVMPMRPQ